MTTFSATDSSLLKHCWDGNMDTYARTLELDKKEFIFY